MRSLLSVLAILVCFASVILADGSYAITLDLGTISKGVKVAKTFNSISLPASNFYLEGVQVVLSNKTSGKVFNHADLPSINIDFTLAGKKIVSFTASNIATAALFPSPYAINVNGAVDLTVNLFPMNEKPQDVELNYYFKWTATGEITKLTRTASSCVDNFAGFNVPKGSGGYTVKNNLVWQNNAQSMTFLATTSPGIISLSFIDASSGAVLCKSTPTYDGKLLLSMSVCPGVYALTKGTTYTTEAVYDNSVARTNVMGNFGFYIGFPAPSTTTHSATTSAATHTTTGPATSDGHSASTAGGHSAGGSGPAGGTSSNSGLPTSSSTSATDTSGNPTGSYTSGAVLESELMWKKYY